MKLFAILCAAAALCASPVLAQDKKWTCSAPGMVSGSYDGGSHAYIHLSGFKSGGRYKVAVSGNTASGKTANGTRFTCKAA